MLETGNEKPTLKSTLTDFLAAPFYTIASGCLMVVAYLTDREYVLVSIEYEEEDEC